MDHGIIKLAALLFACAFYATAVAWRFRGVLADSARGLLGGWLALTPLGRLAAAVFASAAIVYAATKSPTNGPDGASAPRRAPRCAAEPSVRPRVTPEDVARGWQVVSVTTNLAAEIAMPSNAVVHAPWSLRGAFRDWHRVDFAPWSFPLGTNEFSAFAVLPDGTARPSIRRPDGALVAVGAPMSAVPGLSAFGHAVGPDDARLLTWHRFALNRDTNTLVSARLELFPSGDFVSRSNGVETICRRVDPFDWDGDGSVNEYDYDPYFADGDHAGQTDETRASIDQAVGRGLENGLYKLVVTVPERVKRRTLLKVGTDRLVADRPGEYLFLLEKGVRYELGMEPADTNVVFTAVDDVAPQPARAASRAARAPAGGRWTEAGGRLDLVVPYPSVSADSSPHVCWHPALCVSPGNWQPSAQEPSETFTALVSDCPSFYRQCFRWTSGDASVVSIEDPDEQATEMTYRFASANGARTSLSLEVNVADVTLRSVFAYDEEPSPGQLTFALSMPSTGFANDDDDDGMGTEDWQELDLGEWTREDDLMPVDLILTSPVPTNGEVRLESRSGFSGNVYDSMGNPVGPGERWPVEGERCWTNRLYVNASVWTERHLDGMIKARWKPRAGYDLTAMGVFTVVEPVAEPVCAETTNVVENGVARTLVVNPCGVGIGRDAYFRLRVDPPDYPDSEISWRQSGVGRVAFVGTDRGRRVRVRGVTPGDVTLSARIGDCRAAPPSFTLRVVTNSVVKLSAWIVADGEGASPWTEGSVREAVKTAEDVYAQVGVTFDLGDRIVVTNIPAACEVHMPIGNSEHWSVSNLVDVASNTGGLECYFVNAIIDKECSGKGKVTTGVHTPRGLVVSPGEALTLAHEIGHAFGMRDIYRTPLYGEGSLSCPVTHECVSYDWNGGCRGEGVGGSRYYRLGLRQVNLISSLLMNGCSRAEEDAGADIPFGPVYGFEEFIQEPVHVDTGIFVDTGGDNTMSPTHK